MAPRVTNLKGKFIRLGRGETAGLPFDPTGVDGDQLLPIPVDLVERDPEQPRRDFSGLTELTNSVAAHGILQPIIVSRSAAGFRIVAGERRYRAARAAGLKEIPAIVRSIEKHERLRVQLIENLVRKDLNAFEEAESYGRLLVEFGLSQEQLAAQVFKSPSTISETLSVARLGESIQSDYLRMSERGERLPSRSVLLEIAKAEPGAAQERLWEQVKAGRNTVREVRQNRPAIRPDGSARGSPTRPKKRVLATSSATVTVQVAQGEPGDTECARALREALQQIEPVVRS